MASLIEHEWGCTGQGERTSSFTQKRGAGGWVFIHSKVLQSNWTNKHKNYGKGTAVDSLNNKKKGCSGIALTAGPVMVPFLSPS